MSIEWFDLLVQIAGILLAVVGGFGAVPAVNWLKNTLKLRGNAAIALTVAFSVVWGVAELLVGGQIAEDALTLGNLAAIVTAVFAISQAKYNMIKAG